MLKRTEIFEDIEQVCILTVCKVCYKLLKDRAKPISSHNQSHSSVHVGVKKDIPDSKVKNH